MKNKNRKTAILLVVFCVFLVGINIQAISDTGIQNEKQAMIKRFFGEGKKLSAKGKKSWRRAASMGDSSIQHDFGIYLARDGELEEAKQWWRIAASKGCISSLRRLKQAEQIEELENKKLKKSRARVRKK